MGGGGTGAIGGGGGGAHDATPRSTIVAKTPATVVGLIWMILSNCLRGGVDGLPRGAPPKPRRHDYRSVRAIFKAVGGNWRALDAR